MGRPGRVRPRRKKKRRKDWARNRKARDDLALPDPRRYLTPETHKVPPLSRFPGHRRCTKHLAMLLGRGTARDIDRARSLRRTGRGRHATRDRILVRVRFICPCAAAWYTAVWPLGFACSGSALNSSKTRMQSTWLRWAAINSGNDPLPKASAGSPFSCNKVRRQSDLPSCAAPKRGVAPL